MAQYERSSILLALLLLSVVTAPVSTTGAPPPGSDRARSDSPWFGDLRTAPKLDADDIELLVRFAASRLDVTLRPPVLSEKVTADRKPRIVFLTAGDLEQGGRTVTGTGFGVLEAIEQATQQLPRSSKRKSYLRLDLVQSVVASGAQARGPVPPDEAGLVGLAFSDHHEAVYLPEHLWMLGGFLDGNHGDVVTIADIDSRDVAQHWDSSNLGVPYVFTTASAFFDGGQAVRLYRGHRIIEEPSADQCFQASRQAADYLRRSTDENGRFIYIYRPGTDTIPGGYNIVRHAGTVYAMLELYEHSPDQELLSAIERGVDYLLKAVQTAVDTDGVEQPGFLCVVEDAETKLGGNALAVVALARHCRITGSDKHLQTMQRIAAWMIRHQRADGQFTRHIQEYPDGAATGFESQYYPGEAILALLRLYQIDGDDRWVAAASRGADYLINVRDRGLRTDQLSHDHWLLYGLNELYRARQEKHFLTHAERIAEAIVDSQMLSPPYPDWRGAFGGRPTANPTATRTEGLCAAWHLLHDHGREDQAKVLLTSIREAVRFQLQLQYGPELVLLLDRPQQAIGGFRESFPSDEIRIDTVQHNISALLAAGRILELQESDGPE